VTAPLTEDPTWKALLAFLAEHPGCNLGGYKHDMLRRRVQKRMAALGLSTAAAYRDLLATSPDEIAPLLDVVLINVTGFHRDAAAWSALRTAVLPEIVARRGPPEPVRIWSAGCASGEEAYSLAIEMAELVGVEAARSRLQLYATDRDASAVARARRGDYGAREIAGLVPSLRERYFERSGERWIARPELRALVTFGEHDLLRDVPLARMDLVVCRNTLMYLTPDAQARALARLGFSIAVGGYLFLGRAERLPSKSGFAPVAPPHRIARRFEHPAPR
jgi:two-component system CheB/CheR fusion protein